MVAWARHWKVAVAFAMVFLAGGLTGFTAGKAASKRKVQQMSRPEAWAGSTLRKLNQELNLTVEQRREIAPLLRNTARELYLVRRSATENNFQQMRTFYQSLDPVLTEEQREKLAAARERMRQRIKESGEKRNFNPPVRRPPSRMPQNQPPRPPLQEGSQSVRPPLE